MGLHGGTHHPPPRQQVDSVHHQLSGDITGGNDHRADQPSGGGTILMNSEFWKDAIWQRRAQDRLTWKWHMEAFAQRLDTCMTAAQ